MQRASWIIDVVLEVFWDVFGGVSSPVDDNPVSGAPPSPGDAILLSTGDYVLLSTGDKILLS